MHKPIRSLLSVISILAVFIITSGPAYSAESIEWKVDEATLVEIERTEFDDLVGDAFRANVSPALVNSAVELLFDESKPDEVPDEIIAKKRLYALIIAQQKIDEQRDSGVKDGTSAEEIRASAIAAINGLGCAVVAAGGAEVAEVVREFIAPLTEDQQRKVKDYAQALDDFAARLKEKLDTIEERAALLTEETSSPEPQALPSGLDFKNTAQSLYESLGQQEQDSIKAELRSAALEGFTCEGATCSKGIGCEKTVSFKTDRRIVDGAPMQMMYRIVAVPHCLCGG